MTARSLAVALLIAAACATAAWHSGERMRETAFQAPGLVQVVHEGEGGVARDLSQKEGRIRAKAPLSMVLRWLVDPVQLVVAEPAGWVTLGLGDPGKASASLQVSPDELRLSVRRAGGDGDGDGWRVVRPAARDYTLQFDGTAYEVRVDGALIEKAVPGPPPKGPARVSLRPSASLRSIHCRTAAGEQRLISGPQPTSPTARASWAAVTALLGLWALRVWWFARRGTGTGTGTGAATSTAIDAPTEGTPSTTPARGQWLLALVVVAVLLAGLSATLRKHNGTRLTLAPKPCAQNPFATKVELLLQPGRPLDLKARRDGDFELTAQITLGPVSVVDILLRGEPEERDQGVLVTLSTDPVMPVGITANLGTQLRTTNADGRHAVLEPERPHALKIVCLDADTTLFLDGEEVVTARDYDLRAGRTAFLMLGGSATLRELAIRPTGQPRALSEALTRWQWMVGGAVLGGVALLLLWLGGRVSAVLWVWPLAAAVAPGAPTGAVVPCAIAAGLLLLFTPGRGRRVVGWLIGALPLGAFLWAATEQPPVLTPTLLNDMRPADVWGEAMPRAYAWARHPLVRRFNRYVRAQRFREESVALAKTPGVTRVFTLGSSSTFGYGVPAEAAFAKRLEHQLRATGHQVEVFNAGVPGSTAARLALNLEGQLLAYEPDVIVVNLSFNDHIQGAIINENAHYDAMTGAGTSSGIGLLDHLREVLDEQGRVKSWGRFFKASKQGQTPDPELVERHASAPARRFGDELRRMVEAARSVGARLVLVAEAPDPASENTMIEPFHAAMAQLAAELDVVFVDPAPALAPGGKAIYLDAVHLTAEGHERLAAALADALLESGLVK